MPAGVDEREFLAGAKALYARLQGSWDRRDLADIREFASPEVYAEIEAQAAADPVPGRTEILMIDARVLEAREIGHDTVIGVFFDVLLREDAAASAPTQTREVWHFSRDESAAHPSGSSRASSSWRCSPPVRRARPREPARRDPGTAGLPDGGLP
jgi:predicted lipid-binding transport protein (Tim44 family)